MKKGFLINSKLRTITEITIDDSNGLDDIYKAVDCGTFECVDINENNTVYVDEEGLLRLSFDSMFFKLRDYPQPIAGNGLVLGMDWETGESTDSTMTIEELESLITFHTMSEVASI